MEFLDVEMKVKDILVEEFRCSAETIVLASRLRQELGLDEYDVIELIENAEEECGVTILQDELPNILTVGDLIKQLTQSIPD